MVAGGADVVVPVVATWAVEACVRRWNRIAADIACG